MFRPSKTRRSGFPLARTATAITLLSWLVAGLPRVRPVPPPVPYVPEDVPPTWATDINQDASPVPEGGRVVTGKLLVGQKRAKGGTCNTDEQVAIGPGCWVEVAKKPLPPPVRCGSFYEHAGKCYLPVLETRVPNTIVQ